MQFNFVLMIEFKVKKYLLYRIGTILAKPNEKIDIVWV